VTGSILAAEDYAAGATTQAACFDPAASGVAVSIVGPTINTAAPTLWRLR
jgi:hypothetical protein